MNKLVLILLAVSFSCQQRVDKSSDATAIPIKLNPVELYQQQHPDNGKPSVSMGTVGTGSLRNGKLLPFSGTNFQYFDTLSYVGDRAFVHHKVKAAALEAYANLEKLIPDRKFFMMECSHEKGGKFLPHLSHQNGMSIDFMSPILKDGKPNYKLDTMGIPHYWIDFDKDGKFLNDKSLSIDFNTIALHLIELDKSAAANGLKIQRVLLKIELHDDLFKTSNGRKLKEREIYFAQRLAPLVNAVHDDHYHVDFQSK